LVKTIAFSSRTLQQSLLPFGPTGEVGQYHDHPVIAVEERTIRFGQNP
jgi:hypothetical protein